MSSDTAECLYPLCNNYVYYSIVVQAVIAPFSDLSDLEMERYFNFALMWAFGGTLEAPDKEWFSQWWKTTFAPFMEFPEEGSVSRSVLI